MGKLDGKIALVTGATQGIGQAIATMFAAEGATVIVTGILDRDGEALVSRIRANGGNARYEHLDVTVEADWDAVASVARRELGGIDILVNSAGIHAMKSIDETSEDQYDLMQRINVEGPWLGIRSAFREMSHSGRGGAIVNISSLAGLQGIADTIAYCGTKGALTAMTRSAAMEGVRINPPVRVNSVHPGAVMTDMMARLGDPEEVARGFAQQIPIGRVSRAEEIAQAVLFLASDEASYIVGTELPVDGGLSAG